MQKFENVDVIAALSEIMRQNTAFYQSDFDIDKGIIQRAAASDQAVDKTMLWMSRPSGTYCFRERDVFLKDTRQHNTWRFYGEQTRDKILAYAVELTDTKDDTIRGNLYELDYQQHFRHVIDAALPVSVSRLFYEHGSRDIPAEQYFDGSPDRALGDFLHYEFQPHDPAVLQEALQQEQHGRAPGCVNTQAPALYPQAAHRQQTGRQPEKSGGQNQEKGIGGMKMYFTVEEENLICMYHNADHRRTIGRITAALPDMDEGIQTLAQQTLSKLERMTDADYDNQKFNFTDE